jgi:hypothetical protein
VAIFENVPQGQKNVFIPADQMPYKLVKMENHKETLSVDTEIVNHAV